MGLLKEVFTQFIGKLREKKSLLPKSFRKDFVKTISPNDLMHKADETYYFYWGKWALDCVERVLEKAGKQEIKSILDLPCGHGRVLRFLKAAFPEADLTACDIDRDGVDFCIKTFDVNGIYSSDDPAGIQLDKKFDLIWVGSLLTHLDHNKWRSFLKFFSEHLEKDGVLIFTAHGERIIKMLQSGKVDLGLVKNQIDNILQDYEGTGFSYQDYVGYEGIGVSLSSPEWVQNLLEEFPDYTLIEHNPTGWGSEQYYREKGYSNEGYAQDTFALLKTK